MISRFQTPTRITKGAIQQAGERSMAAAVAHGMATRAAANIGCSSSVSLDFSSRSSSLNSEIQRLPLPKWTGAGQTSRKQLKETWSRSFNPRTRSQSRIRRNGGVSARAAGVSSLGHGDILLDALGDSLGAAGGPMATTQAPAMSQRSAEADVMGLLLRQRVVFLGHQVDDFVADAIISQLLLLDAVDPTKDIRLFVNCPGGSISAAMGVYDAIQLCRANVSTIAFGLAASTAAIILAGGSKGKRFAMPNTRIMMHQPLGGASGQAIDVEIQAKEIMYHKNNITRIISEITGRPFEQVSKDMDRDRYMSPVEAMEYGLIDGVIDKDSIIPLAPYTFEKVKQRTTNVNALEDPRKFLNPDISDLEIY